MKTERNILIAFILNLFFSIFEFVGGIVTGSVAIMSDAVHDLGDAASIGISYFLERKSKKVPDEKYTYGYTRFSLLGGMVTTLILLLGSLIVIYNALHRIIEPTKLHYDGMIIFAIVGVIVNFTAAYLTHNGDSINQKAVNLHMLEDVLGWMVVLVGAVVMKFTDYAVIDPIMSLGVAVYILLNAVKNLKKIIDVFLEKTPDSISMDKIKESILRIDGIEDVHHIHLRSIDGHHCDATMHIVTDDNSHEVKEKVRQELAEYGIVHATLELEVVGEPCHGEVCSLELEGAGGCHNHHHH